WSEILVAGRHEHVARRGKDWFKSQARELIVSRVREKAQTLDRKPGRITIRDTKSRWGSCSPDGNLSFCWRLVMAPDAVLDYVVAHEVAHLAELNHGPKFWRWVEELTADVEGAKKWLRLNGEALHRYG
ncbi:MAG TPA: M48 family peptidase, partial [Rhodospirillales bacterium]|nr:M48 family peptidase [Rhodospirillales bacterium]